MQAKKNQKRPDPFWYFLGTLVVLMMPVVAAHICYVKLYPEVRTIALPGESQPTTIRVARDAREITYENRAGFLVYVHPKHGQLVTTTIRGFAKYGHIGQPDRLPTIEEKALWHVAFN